MTKWHQFLLTSIELFLRNMDSKEEKAAYIKRCIRTKLITVDEGIDLIIDNT